MAGKTKIPLEKGFLTISAIAFLFLTTPAWIPGFCAAAVIALLLCVAAWKRPLDPGKIRSLLSKPEMLALGLVVTSAFGVNFYNTWADSSIFLRLASLLGMELNAFVVTASCIGTLAAAPAAACVLSYYISTAVWDFRQTRNGEGKIPAPKALLILFLIFLVGISAILRANMYYQDDAGRAAYGYKHWDYFGRYLSTGLSTFVHMGNYLADAAPLPQILAMGIMAVSSVLVLYIVYERTAFSAWELAAVVPLCLNPYFLECVSFRFDAPYMAVSVLAGIVPLLYRKKSTAAYLFASMLSILAVCTSYQSSTGIYPMLVILLALRMWNRGEAFRETILFCLKSVAGYGLGLVYFKLVIMKPADAGYVSNALPAAQDLLGHTIQNLKQYFLLLRGDFPTFWLGLLLLIAAAFVFVCVRTSKQRSVPALVMALTALSLMTLLCFGIYPVLAATLFAPRAMYGVGVLIALLSIVNAEGKTGISAKLPVLVLSWTFFVFSFQYGNILQLQEEYTRFRMELVIQDLNELEVFASGEPVRVQLSGDIGETPILDNMPQDGQILRRLIPSTLSGNDDLTQYRFFCYYDLPNVIQDKDTYITSMELPIIKDTMYHTIRGGENLVLIELK